MIVCPNKGSKEWKDLVAKVGEDVAHARWNDSNSTINIQRSNLKALEEGQKTISVRPVGTHGYKPGDILNVIVKGKDSSFRVHVDSIHTIEDFTKLPDNRKDDFARAIGDYRNYRDLVTSDDYAREDSPLSVQFPDYYKFLHGKKAQDVIKYSRIEQEQPSILNDIHELANKTKLFLEKKLASLENKLLPNKKKKEADIKKILANIKALDDVTAISVFIDNAYEQVKIAEAQFDKLIKNADQNTRSEMIEKLTSFNEFANGYNILDEIKKIDIEGFFNTQEKGIKEADFSIRQKLKYAISARDDIKDRYISRGLPLLADYLLEYKSENIDVNSLEQIKAAEKRIKELLNDSALSDKSRDKRIKTQEERIKNLKGFSIDKDTLIKQLKMAAFDEGALDFMFSPLISSDDNVIALFAKAIKTALEKARQEDIQTAEEAQEAFDKFVAIKGGKDNVAKFNEDIYEIIEIPNGKDANGNPVYVKRKAFVQKYDITRFEKAKTNFFNKLGPKPVDNEDALKLWKKEVSNWFRANTQPKNQSEIDTIIKQKQEEANMGIITQEEYDEWYDSVVGTYNDEIFYKKELAEPTNDFINSKWSKLYIEDGIPSKGAGEYHSYLLDLYLKKQELLPENFQKGYILPSVPKDSLERSITNGILNTIKVESKETVFRQNYDTEYGLAGLNEQDYKFLPVFYTQSMNAEDVSSNLIESVLQFSSMANRYNALNKIYSEISLMKTVIDKRETIATNSKGQQIMDAFASKMGYNEFIRKNGESYSKKHVDSFVDMIVYGETQKVEEIFGLDAGKISNSLTGYSAITTIAADILKGVSNNIQGNIQITIEANSGAYFDKKNLRAGKAYYVKSAKAFLSDFGTISPKTIQSKLVDHFDAIQGQFKDNYGRNISGSMFRKLFRTNTLFFNQQLGEHEIQVTTMFALLDREQTIDNATGEPITLLEAYKKYGIKGIHENTKFTEKERLAVQNRLHALNKRMHGVYNEFDKGTVQRYALGRLLLMYRKHLIPSYKRRFKQLSADQELGDITEGFYRTFWNTFARDLRDMKFNIANNWSNYTDFEKAQIKRVAAEASFILALTTLVLVLKAAGDDDEELKKNYMYNFLLYQAVRMRSETSSYINPRDAYRVVKSPSAMTTTFERLIRFQDQLIWTWDPEKLHYKRDTGVFKKGTNKSYAYFLKLIGLSGYNFTPEAAVKSFESTLDK